MPNYITYDYRCDNTECSQFKAPQTLLVDRDSRDDQACTFCGDPLVRIWSVPNVTRHSYVDGTKRFGDLKERHKLKQEAAAAKERGDMTTDKLVRREINKVKKG